MLNKKAVSPLIATVLLVMIVVSIGAAVMVVIQGLSNDQIQAIEEQSDLLECGVDVDIDIPTVSSKPRLCINVTTVTNGSIRLLMENTGTKLITGWRVTIVGDDGFNTTAYTTDLATSTLSSFRFNFGGAGDSNSEISLISISPQISAATTVTCTKPELEFDSDAISALDDCNAVSWDDSISATT